VISAVPSSISSTTDNLQKVKTKSVFGSFDYKFVDTLTLQGSARYTQQDRDFQGCLFDNGDGSAATFFSLFFGAHSHRERASRPTRPGLQFPLSGALSMQAMSPGAGA